MKFSVLLILILSSTVTFSQKTENSSLPSPSSQFLNTIELNSETSIEEYITTYFSGEKQITILDSTNWDTDGKFRTCHIKTQYERVTIDKYNCEMFSTFNFVFKGYSKEEVISIMKLLFVDTDNYFWEGDKYGTIEEGVGCLLSITQKETETIVSYGCGC